MTTLDKMSNQEQGESPVAGKLLHLPLARIKTIMRSSPDIGNVSPEAYFLIAKATEMFTQYIAKEGVEVDKNHQTLSYNSLAEIVQSDVSLDFLEDIVPRKITGRKYREIMAERRLKEEKGVGNKLETASS